MIAAIVFAQATAPAPDAAALFATASKLFEQRDYTTAAETLRSLIAAGYRTAAVEYNLGNCLYRLGRPGEARLHYERALRLAPGDADSAANIAFIESRTLKQALWEENLGGIDRVLWAAVTILPRDLLALIGAGAWLGLNLLIGWSLLRPSGNHRALRWTAGILCTVVALLCLGSAVTAEYLAGNRSYGVIVGSEVAVTSEPNRSAPSRFPVPEATKVLITREQGDFREISLPNGTKGWVPVSAVEII